MTLSIVSAKPDDEPLIRSMYAEAVEWLATKGTDQWQPAAMRQRSAPRTEDRTLTAAIARGEVYLVLDDGEPVGALTLDDYADPEFWTETDSPDDALYAHRMIVRRAAAGKGLGAYMLDWAANEAARRGKHWLRLDAWRTNEATTLWT